MSFLAAGQRNLRSLSPESSGCKTTSSTQGLPNSMTSLWKRCLTVKAYHLIKRITMRVISSGAGPRESPSPLWGARVLAHLRGRSQPPPSAHRTLGISEHNKSRRTRRCSNPEEKAGGLDEIAVAARGKHVPRARTSEKDRKSRDSKRTLIFSFLIPLRSQTTVNSPDQGHGKSSQHSFWARTAARAPRALSHLGTLGQPRALPLALALRKAVPRGNKYRIQPAPSSSWRGANAESPTSSVQPPLALRGPDAVPSLAAPRFLPLL